MDRNDKKSEVPTVLNPYRDTALLYRKAGFGGPLPLPYKEKHPPPIDFTKRVSPYPTLDQIKDWREDGKKHNICIRLAGVDKEHELLGIDVDHYQKGDRTKKGHDQLVALEATHGPLPETWISSARTDGKSGIRWFRVPRGLAFRSKVDDDIEVIRKGHRFAVVWPSIHPDGGTYWWFGPGILPDKSGRNLWNGTLPDARKFPLLPESWLNFLTSEKTRAVDDELIDVDSSVDEIYQWATDTFHGDDDTDLCSLMRSKLDKHLKKIEKATALHDLLVAGHWNILHLAFEGHLGWNEAVNELEEAFVKKVVKDGGTTDRDSHTLHGEIFRSRVQALRQIKGKVDERIKIGAKPIDELCTKVGICGSANGSASGSKDARLSVVASGSGVSSDSNVLAGNNNDDGVSDDSDSGPPGELDDVPQGNVKGVPDYRTNDDGNAEHLVDMFSTSSLGPSFRFAEGYGWIVWHEGSGHEGSDSSSLSGNSNGFRSHWQRDELGDQTMRRMWKMVRNRQEAYAEACYGDYLSKLEDFVRGRNNITDQDVKLAKALSEKWRKWSEQSGNNKQAENALKAARSVVGVSLSVNHLDQSPYLLGVANGVVELDREPDNLRLRPARPEDYITLNTRVPWEVPSAHSQNIWREYLDTFLPDPQLQEAVQIALGHCLIGGNPEKIMIVLKGKPNTGKSTMITAIQTALGDYAKPVNQSIFQNHKLNPMLAHAITKRVIVCSEFDEKDQLSASQVKRLTGGSDKISAELKGSNVTVDGIPQFVPILATNEVPTIAGADKALQNRLYVIPFDILPSRIDKAASKVIETICGPAVLNWLIEGYKQYRRIGELPFTTEIKQGTDLFVSELDEVATFASECITKQTSPQGYITRKAMYERFERWWLENKFKSYDQPSMPKFTRRLRALGFDSPENRMRVNGELSHFWVGVKLVKPQREVISLPKVSQKLSGTNPESETDKNGS